MKNLVLYNFLNLRQAERDKLPLLHPCLSVKNKIDKLLMHSKIEYL